MLGDCKSLREKREVMDATEKDKLIEAIGESARELDMKYAG